MFFTLEGKETVTLEELRWKNRIVLFFPAENQNPKFAIKPIEKGMNERKIIFLSIGEQFITNSKASFDQNYLKGLQEKYSPAKGKSNWVLIGLDGGVKLQVEGKPDWDYIFKTIDSMPMRQSEIRKSL
ncbi:DUF4174 domain-containing protein [Aquiflexum sp. LQ15W]|uniref:DUF4174 domain-containing protein n=1 Tax=Cognataquiflexum nitidum TaxID=2922272 RepID=UPI001F14954F|nr:DUF4174 domain-containing protein [Cognataquiflexum nitidum]MCH6201667.1 DUF4174 domain-containing protein [Cognataquiflexum nitidum]